MLSIKVVIIKEGPPEIGWSTHKETTLPRASRDLLGGNLSEHAETLQIVGYNYYIL